MLENQAGIVLQNIGAVAMETISEWLLLFSYGCYCTLLYWDVSKVYPQEIFLSLCTRRVHKRAA